MNVNIEENSALRRKLTIEVEPDEIKRELDKTYNELRRGVVLKGFRPGHAPRNLLEKFFGDQVRSEVTQKLVKEYTDRALSEHNLKPIVEPEIITEETNLPEVLKFSAVFDLKPEVVIKDYEALKVPEETITITDKDVDDAVQRLRERQASLKKVEDRDTVQEGDVAVVSLEGFEDGKPLSETKGENRLLEIRKDSLAHGLDEVLIGAKVGEEARKSKTYDAEYSQKDLAGKIVEWRANVKEIYQRELPNLDDDFAKDQGDVQSLAELRDRVRTDLLTHAKSEADARARAGLLDLVLDRNKIDVPESLVTREQRAMESELASTLRQAGVEEAQISEQVQKSADDIKNRAQKRATTGLVLDALAEQEKVEVNDDELAERIGAIIRQAGTKNRERFSEFYAQEQNREGLRQTMRREKVMDQLLARAKTPAESAVETPPSTEDAPST
jgi:trigger factor